MSYIDKKVFCGEEQRTRKILIFHHFKLHFSHIRRFFIALGWCKVLSVISFVF